MYANRVPHKHQERQHTSGKEVLAEATSFNRRDRSSDQQDPASVVEEMDTEEEKPVAQHSQWLSLANPTTLTSRNDSSDGTEVMMAGAKQKGKEEDSDIVQYVRKVSLAEEAAVNYPTHGSGITESLTPDIKDGSYWIPEGGKRSPENQNNLNETTKVECEFGRPSRTFTGDSAFDGGEDDRAAFNAPRRTATGDSAFYSDGSSENSRSQIRKRRSVLAEEDD